MAETHESVILDVKLDAGAVADDLSQMVERIKALKAQQKDLTEQIKQGNDVNGVYAAQLIRVKDQLTWTEKQAKGLSATTKLLNADTLTYSDSLNGERQKLADMQKAYDQLDASQRDSEGGQAFLASLKAQSEKVKELEQVTGRFQRNVGNYPSAFSGAIPYFDKIQGALGKMGTSLDAVAANGTKAFANVAKGAKSFGLAIITPPVGVVVAVLSAILLVVQKLSEAIKKNDEAGTNLKVAFANLQPVLNLINKGFEALAVVVSKTIVGLANLATGVLKLVPAYAKAAAASAELVVAQDNLEEAERAYIENSAKRAKEIAELRDKAAQTDKYTAEQRIEFLQQASDKERENLEDEKKIAAERLRLLEEKAQKNADTSDEMEKKTAEARAAMYRAEESYYSGTRRLQQQMTAARKEIEKEEEDAAKERQRKLEERRKKAEEERKKTIANLKAFAEQTEDVINGLIADDEERQRAQENTAFARRIAELKAQTLSTAAEIESRDKLIEALTLEHNANLQKIADDAEKARKDAKQKADEEADRIAKEKRQKQQSEDAQDRANEQAQLALDYANGLLSEREFAEKRLQLAKENRAAILRENYATIGEYVAAVLDADQKIIDSKNEVQEATIKTIKVFNSAMSGAAEIFSSILDGMAEDSEEYAVMQKAMAVFNVGVALANGLAQVVGLPGNATIWDKIATLATGTAQVTAAIVAARKALAAAPIPKFADGGVVGGYTSQPSRRDNTFAHVGTGEMILNASQQAQLFQIANGNTPAAGVDYGRLADVVVAAVEAQPAPVVVYSELSEFENKVVTYNNLAKI